MKIYILDASVVLNFLLREDSLTEKKFINLLQKAKSKKIKLYSSYLLPLEVGNGLRYTLTDEELAQEALEKFLNLPIEFFVFKPLHYGKIIELSYQLKTSFYDTSYHFLAKLLKGTFLTADNQYFKKAQRLGNIEFFGGLKC